MKRTNKLFVSPIKIAKIIRKYDSQFFLWSTFHIITSALIPLILVYGPKIIIDSLINNNPFSKTIIIISFFGITLLIFNVLRRLFETKQSISSTRFSRKMQYDFSKKIMTLELWKLEDPKTVNTIQLAGNVSSLTNTVNCVGAIVSSIITIVGLSYAIAKLDIGCIISVVVVVILKTMISWLELRHQKKVRGSYADNNRVGNYLDGVAYFSPGGAKELRVNNAQQWFMSKIVDFRKTMVSLQCKDFSYGTRLEILSAFITAIQTFFVLIFTATRALNGELSLAEFSMVFSATLVLTTAFASFGEQVNNYRSSVLSVSDYENLFEYCGETNGTAKQIDDKKKSIDTIREIVFENVSFSYDGTDSYALEDVNLKIKDKEKLVIVGLNGSGKTTLIKLLCKFYRPTSGRITINGIDIWTIDNSEYYKYIAAVFQDYSIFAFSIFENITMCEELDNSNVDQILSEVGLEKYARKPETIISKLFSDKGIELSGGEGQKLAIARALFQNASILILDEPTSCLDIKAEADIYDNFYKLSNNKTAIFVSHRLACSTVADNIAVFSKGKMIEYGSHSSLIKKNGLYAEMYNKQSDPYLK